MRHPAKTDTQGWIQEFFIGAGVQITFPPPPTHPLPPFVVAHYNSLAPTAYLNSTRKGSAPLEHLPLARLIKTNIAQSKSVLSLLKGVLPKES